MNAIIRYVLDMLPYMAITLPVYLFVRALIIRKKRINPWRECILLFFILFCAGLVSQTVIPKLDFTSSGITIAESGVHTTNLIPLKVFINTIRDLMEGHTYSLIINFFGNVVMFMPFGFFPALLWNIKAHHAALIGFAFSLFVETTQMFLPRSSDVDDLILNTVGALLGYALYKLLDYKLHDFFQKFKIQTKNPTK